MRIVCKEKCNICGNIAEFRISDGATLFREAVCSQCGASIRVSDIAGIISTEFSKLKKIIDTDDIHILNLCSKGKIHELYKNLPNYYCGEFFDSVPSGQKQNDIMCVDLQDIPFDDNYFDLIITEDVLEHVYNIEQALKEINRVLKIGGKHIFTIPIHENAVTMSRRGNPLEVLHGDPLRPEGARVITDFGRDVISFIDRFGMKTCMYKLHTFHTIDEISFIDDEIDSYKKNWKNMLEVFRYNSIVLASTKVFDYGIRRKEENEENNIALPFTGERFIPSVTEKYIVAEHYQRYYSILELVKGKQVLDAACGAGYGSALMASTADSVIGIDIADEAIGFARNNYRDIKNVEYKVASVERLPFEDNSFDVIVSFETIEHVPEKIQNSFLLEIKRCLKDDGILIMSSPDKRTYSDIPNFSNEFHVKEFYFEEFDAFLHKEFQFVEHYLQGEHNLNGELLYPAKDKEYKIKILNDIHTNRDNDRYIVSVCSNRTISTQENISSWFSYEYVPALYSYNDGSYSEEKKIFPVLFEHNNTCTAKFNLNNVHTDGKLRFDPLEMAGCEVDLLSIRTDGVHCRVVPLNAIKTEGSLYTFITIDPIIEIVGDFSKASYIEFEYSIRILTAQEISKIAYKRFAKDENKLSDLANQVKGQEQYIKEITETKGYRLLEKMRMIRRKISAI